MVIFKGKRLLKEWFQEKIVKGTVFAVSEKGWTDNELGLEWLTKVFEPYTAPQAAGKRLLLLDGHDSHCTSQFIDFCYEKDIIPLCLPPHSTHLLQPLDIGIFGPLAKAYKKSIENNSRSGGCYSIDKRDFLEHYTRASSEAITSDNIASSWAAAGLYPFNPAAVIAKLPLRPKTPPELTITGSNGRSVNLVLTPSNPTEIDDIVDQILNGTPHVKQRIMQLSKAATKAIADRIILEHRTKALAEANIRKGKRQT